MFRKTIFLTFFIFLSYAISFEKKDCKKARNYFNQAIALKGDVAGLLKKEYLYKKAIELCPTYAEAHNNLGDVYEKQGRYKEAIAQYKKAIKLKSDISYPYFGIGDIYYKASRYKEAIEWYKKGLKYDPSNELTKQRLALVNDIQEGGIIRAETIKGVFSTTRGVGEVVSITFGEGLIPFDFDKYNIRDDAKLQLDEIGRALRDISDIFEIAGHTDIRGTDEYNLNLSEKRAKAVIDYLVNNFRIPREKLIPKGYGERKPICTEGTSETKETPSNALNRRVEIIRKEGEIITVEGKTRTVVRGKGDVVEPKIILDTGFFYQKYNKGYIGSLKENVSLRSKIDKYFIFIRPVQDCYVYILQEDSNGKLDLLFPQTAKGAYVKKGKDYWVPSFGKAYTLDETKGEEKIYLLATSFPLESLREGEKMEEVVKIATRGLKTQSIKTQPIKIKKPTKIPEYLPPQEKDKILSLIERVEGEGGWVRVVKFKHE